jgi:hypothetical protein
MPDRPPDCLKCAYFKITWESAFPRACLVFGVKSRALPSAEVFQATGRHCPAFQARASGAGAAGAESAGAGAAQDGGGGYGFA